MNKIRESCPDLRHNLNLAVQIFDSTRWQFSAGHNSEKCKTCSRSSIVSKLGVRVACPLCHSMMWNNSWWIMWSGHIFQIHAHLDQKQPARIIFYSSARVLKNSPSSFKRIIEHSSLAATVFMRMRLSRCFIVNGKSFVCCAFPRRSKVCEIGFDWWGARQYKISYFPHLLFSRHLKH